MENKKKETDAEFRKRMESLHEKFECIERDPETKEPIKVKGTRSGIIFSIGDIVLGNGGGLYKEGIAGFQEWDRYLCGFGVWGDGKYGTYGFDSVSCLKHVRDMSKEEIEEMIESYREFEKLGRGDFDINEIMEILKKEAGYEE